MDKKEGIIIIRKHPDDIILTEIPVYHIYVFTYRFEVLKDRRKGNYQVEGLDLDLSTI